MTDFLLFAIMWGLVVYSIQRGYRKERRIDRFAMITWSIFVFLALVCTFRIPAVEAFIDERLSGYPVAYLLNALSTLAAAVLYSVSLVILDRGLQQDSLLGRFQRWFVYAAPVSATLLLSALWASVTGLMSHEESLHLMRFGLSAYLLVLVTVVFIPANWWMFRRENVFPMRLKHLAMLVGLATYASGAVTTVILVPRHLAMGKGPTDFGASFRVVVGGMCFMVILLPHRWIALCLFPVKLYRYFRVVTLERKIGALIVIRREPVPWRLLLHPQHLEMATYIAVINILDHYRRLEQSTASGQAIYAQIEHLLPQNPEYDDLVKAIGRVAA
jgi:hypothetical protein